MHSTHTYCLLLPSNWVGGRYLFSLYDNQVKIKRAAYRKDEKSKDAKMKDYVQKTLLYSYLIK